MAMSEVMSPPRRRKRALTLELYIFWVIIVLVMLMVFGFERYLLLVEQNPDGPGPPIRYVPNKKNLRRAGHAIHKVEKGVAREVRAVEHEVARGFPHVKKDFRVVKHEAVSPQISF